MTERKAAVTFKGAPMTLLGPRTPGVDERIPEFHARKGLAPDSEYDANSDTGHVRIFNVVPSLDTSVCSIQTKKFNDAASTVPGVRIVTVSADLPPAQQRWCGKEGVSNLTMVSDYYDGSFGRAFGLRIKELGVLARSVFVVDRDGMIRYREIVPELTQEPDYEPALKAARDLAGA